MLVQMIYASRPAKPFSATTLNAILATARANNPRHGLTGMLIYDQNHYLQVIEGERRKVNDLLNCLVKDPRHNDFMLLSFTTIPSRMYPNWEMGYAPVLALSHPSLHKHGATDDFNPYLMTEKAAENLFLKLAEVQSAQYAVDE